MVHLRFDHVIPIVAIMKTVFTLTVSVEFRY